MSVGAIKNAAYAAADSSTMTTAPPNACFMTLFLQKILAEKPERHQKDHVKSHQKSDAFPFHERRGVQQPDRHLAARNQHRRKQRQQQQWQQKLSHARLSGDCRERRPCDRNTQAPQKKHHDKLTENRKNRHVEQDGKYRKQQQFRQKQEKCVRRELRGKNREG